MLVFVNGPMGVGKTQVAHELAARAPGGFVCDPERLGKAIQRMTPPALVGEWQNYPLWRTGLVEIAADVATRHDGMVVLPATILDKGHHTEIIGGLRRRGHEVHHFALLATPETLLRRLRSRGDGKRSYGAVRIEQCLAALDDPQFATHVHTDGLGVTEVAEQIAGLTNVDLARRVGPLRQRCRQLVVKTRHLR